MLINPEIIWQQLPIVCLICVITIGGKLLTTGAGAFLTGQSINDSLRIGFSMAQIGEFSFIIAGLGLILHATSNSLYPIIVAVSAITTFTTPYLIKLSGYLGNKIDQNLKKESKNRLESYTNWIHQQTTSSNHQLSYRTAIIRLIINGIIVGIIFTLVKTAILPRFMQLFSVIWISKTLGWFTAILLSSIFIWGMLSAFRLSDISKTNNRLIQYVGGTFTTIEISALSIAYFDTWLNAFGLLFFALLFFIATYKHLDKSYQWFEKRLVQNLNSRPLQKKRYEELSPWDTHFIEVDVNRSSPLIGKTLAQHQIRQEFAINIVAVYRATDVILGPRGHQLIHPFDKLILLGSEEQIGQFTDKFIANDSELEDTDILEKFSIKSFCVDKKSPFISKSIRDSNIREKTQGIVVGIERQGTRLLNPDSTTLLEAGDLLFIVGG